MHGVRTRANTLCPRRRRAHDEIVRREIERFKRAWIQRRKRTKIVRRERQVLQIRGVDPASLDEVAARTRIVQCGIDRRLRPRASDVREDALRAAALIQIIVNERRLQRA
jgi:hypothetical protein